MEFTWKHEQDVNGNWQYNIYWISTFLGRVLHTPMHPSESVRPRTEEDAIAFCNKLSAIFDKVAQ